jgi:putative acetyltransferase
MSREVLHNRAGGKQTFLMPDPRAAASFVHASSGVARAGRRRQNAAPSQLGRSRLRRRRADRTGQAMIELREFRPGDEPALRAVYQSAIHEVAIRDYTQAQVDAWAPPHFDPELWARRMQGIAPFVVEQGGRIVAYADVQTSGYIDHFFVSAAANGQGIGRRLMERIHARAQELGITELTSEVSRTAQPFYKHFGFEIVDRHVKEVRGVGIEYAAMRKVLRA